MKEDQFADPTARRVHKRGMQKRASKISGTKFAGLIQLESQMETTLVLCLEIDPRVDTLRVQPCTIDLNSGRVYRTQKELIDRFKGKNYQPCPYTPDIEVKSTKGGICFLDAKHTAHIRKKPEYIQYPGLLKKLGISLSLVTEVLLQGPIWGNVRLLAPYAGRDLKEVARAAINEIPHTGMKVQELREKLGLTLGEICIAILQGQLSFKIAETELKPDSILQPCGGCQKHLEVLDL